MRIELHAQVGVEVEPGAEGRDRRRIAEPHRRDEAERLGLARIVGLTWPQNVASQRVLEKSGMQREADGEFYGRTMRAFAATRA